MQCACQHKWRVRFTAGRTISMCVWCVWSMLAITSALGRIYCLQADKHVNMCCEGPRDVTINLWLIFMNKAVMPTPRFTRPLWRCDLLQFLAYIPWAEAICSPFQLCYTFTGFETHIYIIIIIKRFCHVLAEWYGHDIRLPDLWRIQPRHRIRNKCYLHSWQTQTESRVVLVETV